MKVIQAGNTSIWGYFKKVYHYRALITTFTYRDIKAEYAQTVLGILWSAIKPLTGLLIFTIFFDKLLTVDTGNVPYPLFAFSGMVSWYYFTFLMAHAGTALINAQNLIKKIYFPKLILPLSKVLVGLVEFGVSLVLLLIMMFVFGKIPGPQIVFLPVFILLNIIVGLTVGIWLSALTVRYRDFHHIIPYLVSFGIWLTPVFYPATLIPAQYQFVLYLNPMAGVIAGFRWSLLGDVMPSAYFLIGLVPVTFLFILGLLYFRKIEDDIADIL